MATSALRALVSQMNQSQGQAPAGMVSAQEAIQNAANRPQQKPMGQQIADVLGGVALPLSAVPVVGDIAGLGADAAMYANYPEERTALNYGLSLAGVLPFVPSAAGIRTAGEAAEGALDMSQAARMQRAKEQGFDVGMPFYHGSGESFDEFDALKMGKTDEGWFGKGFYFSPDPNIANQYAAGRAPNVQKVYLRAKNPYDWRANEGRGMRLGTSDERYAKTREIMAKGYDAVDVYEDTIKLSNNEKLPDDIWYAIVRRSQELGAPVMPRDMVESALKSGMAWGDFASYYGEDVAKMMPIQRKLKERVVFDPANIRSVNAAFDPAKRNSANLMAGVMGGAVGLSALRQLMPQQEQE